MLDLGRLVGEHESAFSKLEKVEERKFHTLSSSYPSTSTTTPRPTRGGRVVLSRSDVLSTIRSLMGRQESDIEMEKRFMDAVIREQQE